MAQRTPPSLVLIFPPQGPMASLSIQPQVGGPGVTHLAFSLKERSEVPGGEFRTFWEPEYRTSMPVERRGACSWGAELHPGRAHCRCRLKQGGRSCRTQPLTSATRRCVQGDGVKF